MHYVYEKDVPLQRVFDLLSLGSLEQLGKYVKIRDLLFLSNTTLEAIMSVTSVKTFSHPLEVHWGPIGLTVRPSLQGAHPPVQLQQEKGCVVFTWLSEL